MITGLCACVVGPSITSERCLDVWGALLAVVASACVMGRVSVSRLEQKLPWHHLRLHRCPPKRLAETAFYPPEGFTVWQSLQSDSFYSVLEQMTPFSPPSRTWKQGSLSFLMILRGQVDLFETQRQNKVDQIDWLSVHSILLFKKEISMSCHPIRLWPTHITHALLFKTQHEPTVTFSD